MAKVTDAEIRKLANDAIEGLEVAIHWWRTTGAAKGPPDITKQRIQELTEQKAYANEILKRL